ncbi:uncharacterized protein [Physcomitrium patens]|uniref:Wall-associated receptor kinase galacturonan-binding domain-containing protein n=1 Tax=Physcomitrium patens TaxID=3218 RepID=A0A2K1IWC2_PHYPA|nr:uncharacterized protein LOC112273157 [Physcomitrium patens]XP_024357399.1 uncharacterized protein LOC112273157 [Physcomitrium patens]PNR33574.1 hypothetical protein PHYPA_025518 [Physcomitrium patens]|eukprot:XP_024357398.1 uncharacterized protein LOC112273157 [Physcomitrella patens]
MKWINHMSLRWLIMSIVLMIMLASTASAGSVVIDQQDKDGICGRTTCPIPGHVLSSTGVHGCTGLEERIGRAPGTLGYVSYKNVCAGGEFSIDWRIYPLRLQFRNSAGDFQECLLASDLRPQGFPTLPDSARRYFTCNMG